MNNFDDQLLRLKQAVKTHADQDVAALLGLSKAAFSDRKKRGAFPEDKVWALAKQKPELLIDVDYVLNGKRTLAHVKAKLATSGERVRQVRDEMAMSAAAFASHLGVGVAVITQAEAGNGGKINELLSPLAIKCAISPMWLLSGELPVLEGDLSPFEVFVIERYRLLGPVQRTALRAFAAQQLVDKLTPEPECEIDLVKDYAPNRTKRAGGG